MAGTPVKTARWRRTVWGELLAEFLGTLVLIAFGDGVVPCKLISLWAGGRLTPTPWLGVESLHQLS